MNEIRIYNTLTKQKEEFKPLDSKRVRMFVCGPTVYEHSHIGHARTYIAFDVIARVLRRFGYPLVYAVNITDIHDDVITRANETGRDWKEIAEENEKGYHKDMENLGVDSIDIYPRASDYVKEMIAQIKALEEKGFTYQTPSGVYYRVPMFKGYGKLSHQKLNDVEHSDELEAGEEKEHAADFALWKAEKPGEPSWDSPWGKGRPGWHIEDTAITHTIFGPQYDLHGGGIDLIFPHHENEIAQNEAAYGVEPLVKIWMHSGHLNVRGEKMSKSLGNFITIEKILEQTTAEAFRLLVLQSHYRSPFDYDDTMLKQTESALERITGFRDRLEATTVNKTTGSDPVVKHVKEAQTAFDAALADDFDTPGAIAVLFELIRDVNPMIEEGKLTEIEKDRVLGFLREVDGVLGIIPAPKVGAPKDVIALAEAREEARRAREFEKSDTIRDQIRTMGWEVEDTDNGPRLIKRK